MVTPNFILPGVEQPKVSALLRVRLCGFSLERLLRFLNLLGQDIIQALSARSTIPACK